MEFNLNRLLSLMKRDMIIYRRPILLGFVAVLTILLLIMGSYAYSEGHSPAQQLLENFVFILLFGLIFTSVIFWEFKSSSGRVHFLGIPVSTLEKLVSRWIYTAILFPLFCCLVCFIVYLVFSPFLQFNGDIFFSHLTRDALRSYWILHPFVFMFSIWYNRYVAPLTVISALGFILLTALVFYVFHRLFFSEIYEGFKIVEGIKIDVNPKFQASTEKKIALLAKILGFVVLPLFFAVVSYFKLKEKEA